MQRLRTIGVIMSLAIALSACTTTRHYNLIDAEARPLLKEMDSVLISKQTEIGADINVSRLSSYVQGHFVPVLIDIGLNTYRSHKASKLITPMRQTLADYDFTQDFKEEFNQALASNNMLDDKGLTIITEEPQGFRAAYIRESEADAVMFVDVTYAFTPTFDALNVKTAVMVFPVNPALSPYKEKPDDDDIIEMDDNIYRNQFMASIPVSLIDGSKDENGDVWAHMSAEELSGKLQKAAIKLADTYAQDLALDDISEDEIEEDAGDSIENSSQVPEPTSEV